MSEIQVKVPVPAEIYEVLVTEQEKLWELNKRKPALSQILLDLCKIGIKNTDIQSNIEQNEQNLFESVQNNCGNEQNSDVFAPSINGIVQKNKKNVVIMHKTKHIFETKDELEAMYTTVQERETELNEKSAKLVQEQEHFLKVQKNFLLEQQKIYSETYNYEWLKNSAKEKDEEIKLLKHENSSFKNLLEKNIQYLHDLKNEFRETKLNDKKEDNFLNKIMPYLPAIALLIYLFLSKKKQESAENVQKQMETVLKNNTFINHKI